MMHDGGHIFSARWVIADAFQCHKDAAIFVRNGRIGDVAPVQDLTARFPEAQVVPGGNTAILPGFVNAHHHCFGVNLLNQGVGDDVLEPWMLATAGTAAISSKISTEYAALRLLKNGVTAVVEACTAGETVALAEAKIREKIGVYNELGMSCAIAPGERWQNHLVHPSGQDQGFLKLLPEHLRKRLKRQHITRTRLKPAEYLDLITRLADENAPVETADVWFGPTAAHWTGQQLLADIANRMRDKGFRAQTHAEESMLQHLSTAAPGEDSAVGQLANAGLLSDRMSLAHMVWAEERDLSRVARMGAHIVCNPSSNLRLRSGVTRAQLMKQLEINLALGMDGTSLAGDDDFFAEMRLARNLYWSADPTEPDLTARDVFDMATMGGARMMGQDHNIGSLQRGKRADFFVIDLDRIQGPWLADTVDPVALLVGSAKSADIKSVYTGGTLAVADGALCDIDEQAVLQNIAEEMQRMPDQRLNAQDYSIVRSSLLRWYDDWLTQRTLGK